MKVTVCIGSSCYLKGSPEIVELLQKSVEEYKLENEVTLTGNFIEGMACVGGCIGGAGCLTHGEKNKAEVDKYGREAMEKTISDAVSVLK